MNHSFESDLFNGSVDLNQEVNIIMNLIIFLSQIRLLKTCNTEPESYGPLL